MDQQILEALTFYADPKSYASANTGTQNVMKDGGVKAKQALVAIQWRDIETAPKDGTPVLLLSNPDTVPTPNGDIHQPAKAAIGCWNHDLDAWTDELGGFDGEIAGLTVTGGWSSSGGWFQPNEVSHWMPLPSASGSKPPSDRSLSFSDPQKARVRELLKQAWRAGYEAGGAMSWSAEDAETQAGDVDRLLAQEVPQ